MRGFDFLHLIEILSLRLRDVRKNRIEVLNTKHSVPIKLTQMRSLIITRGILTILERLTSAFDLYVKSHFYLFFLDWTREEMVKPAGKVVHTKTGANGLPQSGTVIVKYRQFQVGNVSSSPSPPASSFSID